MSRPLTLATSLLFLAVALAGCGGDDPKQEPLPTPPGGPPPLDGTYVMDLERTLGPDAVAPGSAATYAYRFEVRADGSCTFRSGEGEAVFTLEGRWVREDGTLRVTTVSVNGEPVEATDLPDSAYRIETGYLVMEEAGRTIYLKRLDS